MTAVSNLSSGKAVLIVVGVMFATRFVSNDFVNLPHKAYWPEQEASGGPKSVSNMDMFAKEYGPLGVTVF